VADDAPHPRRRTWIGWTIAVVVVLFLGLAGWVAFRGLGAAAALSSAAHTAKELRGELVAGDAAALRAGAKRISADTANARVLTTDPVWRAAEIVPWLGGALRDARLVSEAADDVARRGIPPLLDATEHLDLAGLGLSGGRIDLAGLAATAPGLSSGSAVLESAERALRDVRSDGMPLLGPAVDGVADELRTVARSATALAAAADILPAVFDGTARHDVLVIVQDNARLRSSGGVPAVFALLRVQGGAVALAGTADGGAVRPARAPVGDLSAATTTLFGTTPATHVQDALSAPAFADAARLAATMWSKAEGGRVDAVVAIDAVVLARLLAATGPLTVDGVELTAQNAAAMLLEDVYRQRPDAGQAQAFRTAVTTSLFAALTRTEPQVLLSALLDAGDDHRVRVWLADETAQERLRGSSLAGTTPADDRDAVHVAVLVNDVTGGGMDAYVAAAVSARVGACGADGRAVLRVTVDWSSSAPADAATSLPAAVTAGGDGVIATRLAVVGPSGWRITASSATGDTDGEATTTADDDGRAIVQYGLRTPPGDRQRVTVEFTAPAAASPPRVEVLTTPMRSATPVEVGELACG